MSAATPSTQPAGEPTVVAAPHPARRRLLIGATAAAAVGATHVATAPFAGAAPPSTAWRLGGNPNLATDGSNYLGATNVAPLIFKTTPSASASPREVMRVTANGRLGVGTTNPLSKVDVASPLTVALKAESTSSSGTGVVAVGGSTGVTGDGDSYGGIFSGFYGAYVSGTYGLYASGSSSGVFASGGTNGVTASGSTYGVAASGSTRGVDATSSAIAIYGRSSAYVGMAGDGTYWGVVGQTVASVGTSYGVFGEARTATGGTAYAGGFAGNVAVFGTLSKSAGSFRIDHPLDPSDKWLSHSFVESPDMMNVYNGTATLDSGGRATIQLPDYFEALNRDFRYQLTPIGSAAPNLHVSREVKGNRFAVAGGKAGQRVSWQVTGIRQDAYAKAHPIVVEADKSADERGRFAFVPPNSKGARSVVDRLQAGPHPEVVAPRR